VFAADFEAVVGGQVTGFLKAEALADGEWVAVAASETPNGVTRYDAAVLLVRTRCPMRWVHTLLSPSSSRMDESPL
jgi:hypothetical protein